MQTLPPGEAANSLIQPFADLDRGAAQFPIAEGKVRLIGARSRSSGVGVFPARNVCPKTGARDMAPERFGPEAVLYSFSTVHVSATRPVPYTLGYVDFPDGLRPEITEHGALEAHETAGFGPEALDMVELHDAFTIAELVYYEALGLCPRGGSAAMLRDGATGCGGKVVLNPSGGLLAKGQPVGASGVAQAVEAFWQLTGQAGKRQVETAKTALLQVTGRGIASMDHGACTIHILEAVA